MRQLRRFRQGLTELQQHRQIYFRMVKYKLEETKAPEGYLTDGQKRLNLSITENGKNRRFNRRKPFHFTNQIKRGDLEGVKIGAGTHKRLANVPFKITSKTTERAIS